MSSGQRRPARQKALRAPLASWSDATKIAARASRPGEDLCCRLVSAPATELRANDRAGGQTVEPECFGPATLSRLRHLARLADDQRDGGESMITDQVFDGRTGPVLRRGAQRGVAGNRCRAVDQDHRPIGCGDVGEVDRHEHRTDHQAVDVPTGEVVDDLPFPCPLGIGIGDYEDVAASCSG